MKALCIAALALTIFSLSATPKKAVKAPSVEQWGMYEVKLSAQDIKGNPFDVSLSATFISTEGDTLTVPGFYAGDNNWRVRFMPSRQGLWSYATASSIKALNGKKGMVNCVAPSIGNHGPVSVDTTGLHFWYADSIPYRPVGTTSYNWMHASNDSAFSSAEAGMTMQQQTLKALGESGFNKIRSLLLPHNFSATYPEPELYPFAESGDSLCRWDWTRLNPAYFDHVDFCTEGLRELGIEQDLIVFHPYDGGRWGFDKMPREAGLLLCRYVAARYGAYRNIWWSLANEYDFLREQPIANWDAWTDELIKNDPYHHLISIHSYTAKYYKYWDERYTHCSIQDQAPVEGHGRATTLLNIYKKPVIFDEVCYEGDINARWGWLSGEEELYRMWIANMGGTYCSHSETYMLGNPQDHSHNFLAVGGNFVGESWRRINFMRQIMDALPHPLYLPDSSWDVYTSAAGEGYFMVYLGKEVKREWTFDLPIRNKDKVFPRVKEGEEYRVEIIDTWNMTITECPTTFVTVKKDNYRMVDRDARPVELPELPYLLLRITKK